MQTVGVRPGSSFEEILFELLLDVNALVRLKAGSLSGPSGRWKSDMFLKKSGRDCQAKIWQIAWIIFFFQGCLYSVRS
jgi:hypothetical protein